MKVLWFSNSPALAIEKFETQIKGTGGWLFALNNAIKEKIELSVVFHYPYKTDHFRYQDTDFYAVYTGNIHLNIIKDIFIHSVPDTEFLGSYLSIIEKVNPDLIHIHGTENSFLSMIPEVKVPVVLSIQGNITVIQHKYLAGFNGKYLLESKYNGIKSILNYSKFYRGYIRFNKMASMEQKWMKFAKYIIGRTDWDKRISLILSPTSKYYCGNEILREEFYNHEWNKTFSYDKFIIFTTNSDNYYKGFETLCHSLKLLTDLGVSVEWRVAGVSENSLIVKITKKFLKKNYPKYGLKLLGSLNEVQLIKNLLESDIYVMPSHIENSPNSLCEAMILGMPCIATFAGGTGSLLKDGEEGILVQDGDPWAMAGAILELFNNQEKAIRFGKTARKRALVRHDKQKIVEELLQTYQEIISDCKITN